VQPSTLKKLRQGKLAIDNSIDLHVMTVDEARSYLLDFLGECEVDGSRVILIVHGKGYSSPGAKPIIKPMVNRWLREVTNVLAFHSAQPVDGGTGAVYVLLRRID
jgi:DNA-nicking Smr family endonuclease